MLEYSLLTLAVFSALTLSQHVQQTTPVPILNQINRVNDDGSYMYGYESADGTYKLEIRDNSGNVRGKYAYYDETGDFKTVEYAAGEPTQTKGGFEARGSHIHEHPKSAPHDPFAVTDDEATDDEVPEQQNARAKHLKHANDWKSQPHHQSPSSAFTSSDSDNWQQPAPQHRFSAPQQRSVWDDNNAEMANNSNNNERRRFGSGFEVANPASRNNHAANNKHNHQPKQSAFDIDFQNFPSSF